MPKAALGLVLMAVAKDGLLRQPVRRRLLDLIKRTPGIHASELCRESGEAWGTVHYHLGLLAQNDLIGAHETGREKRFFAADLEPQKAHLLSLLHHGRRGEIARFIHEHPGIRQVDVCEGIRVSRKTFRSSIAPLIDQGLVTEQKGLQSNRYFAEEPLGDLLEPSPDYV